MNGSITLVTEKIKHLVNKSAGKLDVFLADFLKDEAQASLPSGVQIFEVHNFNGYSGYNYWFNNLLIGQIHLATLVTGSFVVSKKFTDPDTNITTESYDYYDSQGNYTDSTDVCAFSTVIYSSINMEPMSPFLNHFYNILNSEYKMKGLGSLQTRQIFTIEQFLRKFADEKIGMAIDDGVNDFAYLNIAREIYLTEADPILRWSERRKVYESLKQVRDQIISTKRRVHRLNMLTYDLIIKARDIKINLALFKRRPMSNFNGMLQRHTIGHLFWFYHTVKNNLGLSVAMAIYGPFTYFFITQPMNPHAMNVVGKLRNSYYNVVESFEDKFSDSESSNSSVEGTSDIITTENAAPIVHITKSGVGLSWQKRMNHFKALEVGFRKNMIDAVRFGRLEHMENQFSFSIVVEGLWHELTRYEKSINSTLKYNPSLDYRFKKYLKDELTLVTQVKTYSWNKLSEFFLNHPYIVVDQDNEQLKKDYYNAKAFILWERMTKELFNKTIDKATHPKVALIAKEFANKKISANGVMENLKKNSLIYKQKNPFDATELRSYMERHWEVLFLQQNKKEEASSFALQTYTWSVRNAVYAFQSIFSAKRQDLLDLSYKFNMANQNTDSITPDSEINEYYESLIHLVTLEFTSIKRELVENIEHSDEAQKREIVIKAITKSVSTRDSLYKIKKRIAKLKSNKAKI